MHNILPTRLLTGALTLNLCCAAAALATERELPLVTVSASRGSQLADMDVSTTTLSSEAVRRAPQLSTEQMVDRIPGVFSLQRPAAQLHPTAAVFSIRGFGTTTNVNTLVMVDGIPINDAYFRTVDWNLVPKESVQRIEVIRGGGATSLWGNLAMGGVVNVVTRPPAAGEGRFNLSHGSFDTTTADAAVTVFSNDRLSVGLSYDGVRTDGYNLTPREFRNPNMTATESHTDNAGVSADFTPTDSSHYYFRVFAHRTKEEGLVWRHTENTWKTLRFSGGGSTRLADGASLNVNAWYDNAGMDTQNVSLENGGAPYTFNINTPDIGTPYIAQTEAVRYHSGGGSLFYQTEWGNLRDIKVGADLRDISARDPLQVFDVNGLTADIVSRGRHRFQGLFAQGTWRPATLPVDITLGLREDFWQAVDGDISGTVKTAALENRLDDQSYHRFDPRLGVKYHLPRGFDLRAAAYRNFAAPGMNQMYRSFISGSSYTSASPTLKPQTNTGGEIGADYTGQRFDAAFTLFHNRLQGFIDYAALCTTAATCNPLIADSGLPTGSVTRVNRYVNAGDAVLRGGEIIAHWRADERVQFNAGFTRTDAHLTRSDYTAADPVDQQIGQVPAWMATAGADWQATTRLQLALTLKRFPNYWNDTAHTQRNAGATLADVGARYLVNRHLTLYALAQNIGDVHYYDQGLGYTTSNGSTVRTSTIPALGMPRNITVGLSAQF